MKVFDPAKQKLTDFRYLHLKRDGHMIHVIKSDLGKIQVFTKNWNKVDLSWHPIWANLVTRLRVDTWLQCELWKPGHKASYISSGLVQQDPGLILECFAAPKLGHATEAKAYSMSLAQVAVECRHWGVPFIPFYDRLQEPLSMGAGPLFTTSTYARKTLEGIPLDADTEGFVLKNSNLSEPYKWKPFKDADLRITGVSPGKGKFAGQVGALICSLENGVEVANVSGMTDKERQHMTELHNAGNLLQRIVEVRYQYVNSQGRLRHASFVRFRDPSEKAVADVELY